MHDATDYAYSLIDSSKKKIRFFLKILKRPTSIFSILFQNDQNFKSEFFRFLVF
jgi:hypothetical protein